MTARLFCASSESMRLVEDHEITLTVTSPPYFNAIDYDRYAVDPGDDYRTRRYAVGFEDYASYLALMTRVFSEVHRVTRPGGYCVIVVASIQDDGRCRPIPFDLTNRLISIGWTLWHEIIWHKGSSALDRAGTFVKRPFPDYYHPNIMNEQVLIFRKSGPRLRSQIDESSRQEAKLPVTPLVTREILNNVWHIPVVPRRSLDHPCPFPEEIPHRLILLYSHPGDVVLDPFLGSGQTTKVAHALGRDCVGFDLERRFVDYAQARLAEPLRIRPQLVATYDRITDDAFTLLGAGDTR